MRNTKMDLRLIIDKIQRDKNLDLSGYKESTITRRIERRMQFDGAKSLEEYIQMIDRDHHLYWRLVSDFFIGVTDFFRDKEVWDIVSDNVLPEIIRKKTNLATRYSLLATSPILRIWSAGCSTGEETYSLAIAVKEVLRKENIKDLPIFIYGTDIMEDKLEIARIGEYDAEKVEKVEEGLRKKYFVYPNEHESKAELPRIRENSDKICDNSCYMISSALRQPTRFRKYDLTKPETLAGFDTSTSLSINPERTKRVEWVDMIVCRNVLIYFQRHLQEKVLKNFHRALREGGILWLGTAESLPGEAAKLFEPLYKNEKIFRKR